MKGLAKLFIVLFLVSGLIITGCFEKDEEAKIQKTSSAKGKTSGTEAMVPWDDYGYKKATQFHLRYYYIFGEAVNKVLSGEMRWEEAINDNTGIVEVWFKSDGGLFRLDRYIEKLKAKCKSYKGKRPDTISYNGKTYSLHGRTIQKGKQFTSYAFRYKTQIGYDRQTKQAISPDCYYREFTTQKEKPVDQGSVLSSMTVGHVSLAGFGFYLTKKSGDEKLDKASEEIRKSALELTKIMNPSEYKKIIEGWKVKKEIAGRTAVKNYMSPPPLRGSPVKGFQFIDTELGIGLAGYLEGCSKSWVYQETKFEEPKLVYKALLVETTVSPDVFETFLK